MPQNQSSDKSQLLADLPPYIYGTTRLGDDKIPFEQRIRLARAAMESVSWFHTSHTYGMLSRYCAPLSIRTGLVSPV